MSGISSDDLARLLTHPGIAIVHHNSASRPQPKQNLPVAALDEDERKTLYAGRVSVRITSYRRRLLDPDNLIPKWFLDSCRHSKLIRGDSPEDITLEVRQEKVKRKEDERTEIKITPEIIQP